MIEKYRNLDIFGNNSLYQYLCVANTKEGKKKLASYLTENKPDINLIYERQKAVQELIEKKEFSLEFETLSMLIDKKNGKEEDNWYDSFLEFLNKKDRLINEMTHICSFILPIISLILLYLSIKGAVKIEFFCLLIGIQLLSTYYISYKNKGITKKVFHFCLSMEAYLKIIENIEQTQFKSKYLKKLQKKLGGNGELAKGIMKLYRLNDAFAVQTNPYIHLVFQLFIMYDIHCIRFLENWNKHYALSMSELFKAIGEIEALLSLSVIGMDRNFTYPKFVEGDKIRLEVKEIVHPLIEKENVIANSLFVGNGIEIITGSNMSGKTTFMRTIGINGVLAYAGAPVCAQNMKLSVMKIFTSMRVMDDVSKGMSSFYAEVMRIKEMVDYSKSEKPMLVLIDEIFKGTNSADRIIGAKEVLRGLNKKHIMALVSTHDFELCRLIEENEINGHNNHFEEYYRDDKKCFDYKLKEGKCKTTNAKHILKMAGLI